jgi:hypothetical protein
MSSQDSTNTANTGDTTDTADLNSYKFDPKLDPSVSPFFSDNRLKDWTFDNFFAYIRKEKPKAVYNNVLEEYKQNIKKINENKGIKQAVRSQAGHVFQDSLVSFLIVSLL